MSFQDILASNPFLDISWELFKGVAPTLVALLAIWLNNRGASKRSINNKKLELLIKKCENELNLLNEHEKNTHDLFTEAYILVINKSQENYETCLQRYTDLGNQVFLTAALLADRSVLWDSNEHIKKILKKISTDTADLRIELFQTIEENRKLLQSDKAMFNFSKFTQLLHNQELPILKEINEAKKYIYEIIKDPF